MTGERLAQMGWPYPGQPINVDFDVNWDSPQARGLVAWWPMIGSQGGWPVPDRALYRYPMTPVNGPTWASDSVKGWSVLFDDGANEYLSIGNPVVTGTPLTMTCWFNSNDATAGQCLMIVADTGSANNYHALWARGDWGGDPIQARTRAGAVFTAASIAGYTANQWEFAAGVWAAANDRRVYLNDLKATNATAGTPAGLDTTSIGAHVVNAISLYMSGRIMDARIYNRALDDTEINNVRTKPWELYAPRIYQQRAYVAAAAGAIMNQIQYSNLGADLYNGALIL